jgi:HAMP domain-containing protein
MSEDGELDLKDIHLPEPVGWWPLAPGWWGLLGLILLGLLAFGLWRNRRRKFAPRRAALEELRKLDGDFSLPVPEKLQAVSILLRRTALTVWPREEVAGLSGTAWLKWLDRLLDDGRFSQGPGRVLLDAPYRPQAEADWSEVSRLCRDWLKKLPPVGGKRRRT